MYTENTCRETLSYTSADQRPRRMNARLSRCSLDRFSALLWLCLFVCACVAPRPRLLACGLGVCLPPSPVHLNCFPRPNPPPRSQSSRSPFRHSLGSVRKTNGGGKSRNRESLRGLAQPNNNKGERKKVISRVLLPFRPTLAHSFSIPV